MSHPRQEFELFIRLKNGKVYKNDTIGYTQDGNLFELIDEAAGDVYRLDMDSGVESIHLRLMDPETEGEV